MSRATEKELSLLYCVRYKKYLNSIEQYNCSQSNNGVYCVAIHRKSNIFDNMIAKLEKYSKNLEEIVDERTDQLREEKRRTEELLHQMLPP